jgi:hypothetical protein
VSGQITLAAFTAPQSTLPQPKVYDCTTCKRQRGFFEIGGKQKVRCTPQGLRDIPNGCGGWMDDEDLAAFWPAKPSNFYHKEAPEANAPSCPECGATLGRRPAKHIHAGLHYCRQCGYSEKEAAP